MRLCDEMDLCIILSFTEGDIIRNHCFQWCKNEILNGKTWLMIVGICLAYVRNEIEFYF